jgi:hypothetical protein
MIVLTRGRWKRNKRVLIEYNDSGVNFEEEVDNGGV